MLLTAGSYSGWQWEKDKKKETWKALWPHFPKIYISMKPIVSTHRRTWPHPSSSRPLQTLPAWSSPPPPRPLPWLWTDPSWTCPWLLDWLHSPLRKWHTHASKLMRRISKRAQWGGVGKERGKKEALLRRKGKKGARRKEKERKEKNAQGDTDTHGHKKRCHRPTFFPHPPSLSNWSARKINMRRLRTAQTLPSL